MFTSSHAHAALQVLVKSALHAAEEAGAEVEGQAEMNDALMAELETLSTSQGELVEQNSRLLQALSERDEVNKELMARNMQLRDVREAQGAEAEGLRQRLHALDRHRCVFRVHTD